MDRVNDRRGEERAAAWGRWVVRRRWPILLGSVLAIVTTTAGTRFLGFSNDYRAFFGSDNPQLTAFEALQNIYTKNDNILIVVAPRDGDVFSREALSAIDELVDEAWRIPFALRVDAVTNWQHTEASEDELSVHDLVPDPRTMSVGQRKEARRVALEEPLLARRLVSTDGRVTGVNVTLQFPEESPDEPSEAVAYARELARRMEATHPGIEIHLTGMVMLSNSFAEEAEHDMTTLVPLMYLAIAVALIALLRSVSGTVATMLVIGASVATAMGVAGYAGTLLTPPSASAPTMIMTLAVADSVHLLVGMFQAMRKGLSKHDAIVESMRVNLQPVFLTSLTTAIGFLSMNFSDAPPFWDLGNITAIGVTAAFAYAVLTLPALMAVLPIRVRAASGSSARARLMQWVGDFVVARRRVLLLGSGLATLVLGGLVPLNELNDDFVDYFDERVAFRRDTDFTSENLTGIYALEFSLSSGETDGITTPAYLEAVDHFADWYGEQPGVVHVASFSQVMKRLNRSMNGDDASFYRVPGRRDLAAQYLLLYELSLPYGLDLNNQINVAKSATRFVVTVENVTSRELRELAAAGEAWLRSNAPPSMHATASSASLMFSHISERNIRGMLGGTLLAFVLVTVVLVLALRSVGFGLISLIPNVVPAVLAFGLWGVTVGRVNIGLSVVVAMTMGIVVDDTVHFLSKYLRARRERGLGPQDAVRYAFTSVGSALVFTSLVLAVGFGVLAYSAFDLNAGMGKLTALTIALALIADFLLLPPLLMRLEEWRERVPGAALVLGAEARAEVGGAD